MNEACHLHIEAAVFCDIENLAFAPPADRVEAVRCFPDSECGLGDVFEFEPVTGNALDFLQEVEGHEVLAQIEDRVGHEHIIVEAHMVEAHDEVRPLKAFDQLLGAVLAENLVAIVPGTVGHTEGHPHLVLFIPTPDIVRGSLGLKVEIDNIHGMLRALGRIGFR